MKLSDIVKSMKIDVVPRTNGGKWAVGLIVAMFLLFFAGTSLFGVLYQSVPAGNSIAEDIAGRPALAFTMLAGMLCGILAFGFGLFAITRQKERSILTYAASIIGALLILFLLGEFLFPH